MQINKKISLNPSTGEAQNLEILINPASALIPSFTGTVIYTYHFDKIDLSAHKECDLILVGNEYSTELPHAVLRGKKKYFEIGKMSFCMLPGVKNYTTIIKETGEKTIILKDKESKLPFAITEDMIIKHY